METARWLSIKQLLFQEWFGICQATFIRSTMLTPPRPQHEVVQNEQGRYIDIVTVMKGRQPVKKGRLYIKKKSEHRTQSTIPQICLAN